MGTLRRRVVSVAFAGALAAGAVVGGGGVAQANPSCMVVPMGVAGAALCMGPGEHRIVLDCVDQFFPAPFSSSHRYTAKVVEGQWAWPGGLSFATCLGAGGMLPVASNVRLELR